MSKHTPGPWNIYIGEGTRPIAIYQDDRRRKTVASFHASVVKTPDGETQANARLIAAAPELLDALIHMAAHCESMEAQHPDYHNEEGPLLSSDLREALAAIAKATGE